MAHQEAEKGEDPTMGLGRIRTAAVALAIWALLGLALPTTAEGAPPPPATLDFREPTTDGQIAWAITFSPRATEDLFRSEGQDEIRLQRAIERLVELEVRELGVCSGPWYFNLDQVPTVSKVGAMTVRGFCKPDSIPRDPTA
jgi:hypothetical protein